MKFKTLARVPQYLKDIGTPYDSIANQNLPLASRSTLFTFILKLPSIAFAADPPLHCQHATPEPNQHTPPRFSKLATTPATMPLLEEYVDNFQIGCFFSFCFSNFGFAKQLLSIRALK